jgi:glycosyltransferase involved in cell wall biosynthesis
MYQGKKVSVVMPAYNEEEAIVQVINDFKKDFVDEIIVVDNSSTDGTVRLAEQVGAKVVKETERGQGYACIRALKEATGDLIFLTESDTTFLGKDMYKLLQYIDDFDIVFGSRLQRSMIGPKAMNWWTLWGNWILSTLIQWKYGNKVNLNDVGVTFSLYRREALDKIKDELRSRKGEFTSEPMVLALKKKLKVVQIPTWYTSRRGLTKQSFSIWSSCIIGFTHLKNILLR